MARKSIRNTGSGDEALAMALTIGSVISFASMLMASQVGEIQALRLHATELLLLLGTAIVFLIEGSAQPKVDDGETADNLDLEQSQLPYNS
jgi:hypothetical protein